MTYLGCSGPWSLRMSQLWRLSRKVIMCAVLYGPRFAWWWRMPSWPIAHIVMLPACCPGTLIMAQCPMIFWTQSLLFLQGWNLPHPHILAYDILHLLLAHWLSERDKTKQCSCLLTNMVLSAIIWSCSSLSLMQIFVNDHMYNVRLLGWPLSPDADFLAVLQQHLNWFIDPSHYESAVHIALPVSLQYLQFSYRNDPCSRVAALIWLSPLAMASFMLIPWLSTWSTTVSLISPVIVLLTLLCY